MKVLYHVAGAMTAAHTPASLAHGAHTLRACRRDAVIRVVGAS